MFSKGKHDRKALAKGEAKSGRVFRTVGYALAGTALLSFSTVQSGLVNPQAIAETSSDGSDQATTQDASVTSTLAYSSAANASEKNETVYVFSNADGTVKNTKVSAELKNPDGAATLKDQTDLTNIENTENDGEHATTSEGTVWETKGDNVYYMGDTDKEAPVQMKVSYKLDGEDISADDLLGKSGKVTIRFDFTNNSYEWKTVNGKRVKIYTPFMALTGLMLDNDQFSDVKAKNAKVLDDGDRTIVAGYALPGLQESLDVDEDDYKVPDYIQITADTTDFELNQTLTMVTNDLFNDIDTDKLDADKLDDAIDQLQDGMDQLIDGSGALVTGLNNLSSGAHTLSTGVGTLNNGTSKLRKSTKSLPSSVKTLNKGMQTLNKGLKSASSGSKTLSKGTTTLYDSLMLFKNGDSSQTGLKDALEGIGGDDDTGSATLIGGINAMKSGVDDMLPTITTLQQVADGVLENNDDNIATVLKTLKSSQGAIDALNKKIDALPDDASYSVAGLKTQLSTLKTKITSAKTQVTSAKKMLSSVSSSLGSIDTETLTQAATAAGEDAQKAATTAQEAQTAAAALDKLDKTGMTDEQKTAVQSAQSALADSATQLASSAKSSGALATDVSQLGNALSSLPSSEQIQAISATLDEVDGYLSEANLAKASVYIDAVNSVISSLDTDELSYDTALLKQYYKTIEAYLSALDPDTAATDLQTRVNTAAGSFQALSDGLAAEKAGLQALRDGGTTADGRTSAGISGAVDALGDDDTEGTLINGAKQLDAGAASLSSGLASAASGSSKLAAGTKKLNAAAPQLYQGIVSLDNGAAKLATGSKTLASGADTAASGAEELADGLKKYNREGIQKIVDAYNDNLKGLTDRVDALQEAGKAYTNFSGIAQGTKGKVKFVYETDAIEHSDDE